MNRSWPWYAYQTFVLACLALGLAALINSVRPM